MQKENELFSRLNEIKKEINALKNKLNEIDKEKESWFGKKEGCSKKIRGLIISVREKRGKRDKLTKKVRDDKEKRNALNEKIKNSISEIKRLNQEKNSLIKKHGFKEDPFRIKGEIDRLELKIETEAMPFDKEKKITKQVKELKRRFDESKILGDILEKGGSLGKEAYNLKSEAEILHESIQENAKQSQAIHEGIIADSGEIDKLKLSEEESFSKFLELKKSFSEINSVLKEKLGEYSSLSSEMQKMRDENEEKLIRDKEEFIREKIKKGQKLTTEDLWIFQNQKK